MVLKKPPRPVLKSREEKQREWEQYKEQYKQAGPRPHFAVLVTDENGQTSYLQAIGAERLGRPAIGKSTDIAPQAAQQTTSRLDEICDELTVNQRRIVRFLWGRSHKTDWAVLAEECAMSPEPSAVKRALQRLTTRLLKKEIQDVYLETNEGTKRVSLIHP